MVGKPSKISLVLLYVVSLAFSGLFSLWYHGFYSAHATFIDGQPISTLDGMSVSQSLALVSTGDLAFRSIFSFFGHYPFFVETDQNHFPAAIALTMLLAFCILAWVGRNLFAAIASFRAGISGKGISALSRMLLGLSIAYGIGVGFWFSYDLYQHQPEGTHCQFIIADDGLRKLAESLGLGSGGEVSPDPFIAIERAQMPPEEVSRGEALFAERLDELGGTVPLKEECRKIGETYTVAPLDSWLWAIMVTVTPAALALAFFAFVHGAGRRAGRLKWPLFTPRRFVGLALLLASWTLAWSAFYVVFEPLGSSGDNLAEFLAFLMIVPLCAWLAFRGLHSMRERK
ncbi:MAG: hypothetical protein ACPGOV_02100 [Magnetovibrionaceae bacterium]